MLEEAEVALVHYENTSYPGGSFLSVHRVCDSRRFAGSGSQHNAAPRRLSIRPCNFSLSYGTADNKGC
jgi:hypothetical protein